MRIQNGGFGPIDISVSGLKAQGRNVEVISSNIANAHTVDAGNGQPYRRLEAVFKTESGPDQLGGVSLVDVLPDKGALNSVYDPGNPKADSNGFVAMPNVDIPTEMVNLTMASRAYQANASVLKRYQAMVDVSLELLK
jgi:flagellar basal-body rod protein FlgC